MNGNEINKRVYILAIVTIGVLILLGIYLMSASAIFDPALNKPEPEPEPAVYIFIINPETSFDDVLDAYTCEVTEIEDTLQEPRYNFTEDDIYLLAQLLCGSGEKDGDGEYDIDFQKNVNYIEAYKVLNVVINRVNSDQFPDNIYDVVMQKNQFSVMPRNSEKTPSEKAIQVVTEWCEKYNNHDPEAQVIPEDHLYFTGNGVINKTRPNYR